MADRCPRCLHPLENDDVRVCTGCGYQLRFHPLMPLGLAMLAFGLALLTVWAFAPLPAFDVLSVSLQDVILLVGTAALVLGIGLVFLGGLILRLASLRLAA